MNEVFLVQRNFQLTFVKDVCTNMFCTDMARNTESFQSLNKLASLKKKPGEVSITIFK